MLHLSKQVLTRYRDAEPRHLTGRLGKWFDIELFDLVRLAMTAHYQGGLQQTTALGSFIKLMRAGNSVYARLHKGLAKFGITHGQLAVLEALLHLGPMSQRELGRKLLRSSSNVTTLLDNLERRSLIQRKRLLDDRRVLIVSLTGRGKRLIEKVFPLHARRITDLFSVLSANEQQELGRLCKKLGCSVESLATSDNGSR